MPLSINAGGISSRIVPNLIQMIPWYAHLLPLNNVVFDFAVEESLERFLQGLDCCVVEFGYLQKEPEINHSAVSIY